jgi:hypothetical protein
MKVKRPNELSGRVRTAVAVGGAMALLGCLLPFATVCGESLYIIELAVKVTLLDVAGADSLPPHSYGWGYNHPKQHAAPDVGCVLALASAYVHGINCLCWRVECW